MVEICVTVSHYDRITETDKKDSPSSVDQGKQILFICALIFANFAEASCFSLQAPFFPKLALDRGVSPAIYGAIFAVLEVTVLISAPIYGKLVAYVSCNALMQFGLTLAGLSVISFGFTNFLPSGHIFIIICFIIRIMNGLGVSAYLTSSYAAMAYQFPHKIASVFGLLEVAFSLGSTLGPTVGGLLYEQGGYLIPFLTLGSTLLIAALLNLFCAPKVVPSEKRQPVKLKTFLSDLETNIDLLSICVAFTNLGILNVILGPHLFPYQLRPVLLGLVFATQGLAYAFTSPIIGWIIDHRIEPKVMNLFSCPISLVGTLLLGPAPFLHLRPKIWLIIISLILIGIGEAGRALSGFISVKRVTTSRRGYTESIETYGLITSTFLSCTSIGFTVGPLIGGSILDAFGSTEVTFVMITLNILMMLLLSTDLIYHRHRRSQTRTDLRRNWTVLSLFRCRTMCTLHKQSAKSKWEVKEEEIIE